MTEEKERALFEDMIRRHTAALNDILARYVGRLSRRDREWFIGNTLEIAWENRSMFDPTKRHLIAYWEDCCRETARSRPTWRVITTTGYATVKNRRLGR